MIRSYHVTFQSLSQALIVDLGSVRLTAIHCCRQDACTRTSRKSTDRYRSFDDRYLSLILSSLSPLSLSRASTCLGLLPCSRDVFMQALGVFHRQLYYIYIYIYINALSIGNSVTPLDIINSSLHLPAPTFDDSKSLPQMSLLNADDVSRTVVWCL